MRASSILLSMWLHKPCFLHLHNAENSENNGTVEIGLATPTPGAMLIYVQLDYYDKIQNGIRIFSKRMH